MDATETAHTKRMLTLFLRASLLYLLVFAVLRLTGKRQVSDLQPFDLLITLMIADLASCAIADTSIPLVYSIVPIFALYLLQTGIAYLCLKSAGFRRLMCGNPVILVANGVLQEEAMRRTNYTIIDLVDQLRENGVFDIDEVAYAILETNGTVSILPKGAYQNPTVAQMGLQTEEAGLSHMLVLDGHLCPSTISACSLTGEQVTKKLKRMGIAHLKDTFYLSLSNDGTLRAQSTARTGSHVYTAKLKEGKNRV